MKFNRIQALVLTLGVALSSGVMFAGKANAAPTATVGSTATFTGNVGASCTVPALFPTGAGYVTLVSGPSGGAKQIQASSGTALFNCNSNTVAIAASAVTATPSYSGAAPTNALNLTATHVASVFDVTHASAPLSLPAGSVAADPDGNISLQAVSTWTGAGEDLLDGTYTASITIDVTAN